MDMKEARTVVKAASNMVRAFARLDEALETAITAETLTKERAEAVEAVGRKLQEANSAFALACEDHAKQRQQMHDELAALQRKVGDAKAKAEQELADAEAQKVAAIAVARNKQADAEHEAESAIDFLNQRKAALEKEVKQLETALDKLKARVTAV